MLKYAKAITGTLVACLGAVSTALPGGISTDDWINIVLVPLVAFGAIYQVPNKTGG